MVTREEIRELVKDHASLDEPMDTAIWIRPQEPDAWLVEVLPALGADEHPERAVNFGPGRAFRHPLHLIASNREDLERAIRLDVELAGWIAEGEVLHGDRLGQALKDLAVEVAGGHARAG